MLVKKDLVFEQLKAKGNAAFRDGSYADAYELYSSAERQNPGCVNVLLNKSLTALRLGEVASSLRDAQRAQHVLKKKGAESGERKTRTAEKDLAERQAKAFYREGSALAALGRFEEAARAYKRGLQCQPRERGLCQALRKISHHLRVDWLAEYLRDLVVDAQTPNPFSSRDGKLLKPPLDKYELHPSELQAKIREALLGRESEFRGFICDCWNAGRDPRRCILSIVRAYCYLSASKEDEGAIEQSLRDAKAAVAYMPAAKKQKSENENEKENEREREKGDDKDEKGRNGSDALRGRARAVHSAVLERLGEYAGAAIAMFEAKAHAQECEEYEVDLMRLRDKLSDAQREALDEGGSEGLRQWLEDERERNLPEFMRKRPKYYYYYEWTKKRIGEHYPELPQPVVDKLLTTDADELDLLLQYPHAIKGQVEEYLSVLREKGPEYLETYETPRLSWDEVRALNISSSSQSSVVGQEKATYHALVAGGGEGQLTDAERKGVPVKPTLDPDTQRDLQALEMDRERQQLRMLSLGAEGEGEGEEGGGGGGGGGRREKILRKGAADTGGAPDLDGVD